MTSDDLGLPRIPVQAAEGKPLRHLAWADMPAYGKLDFLQLREAVSEAIFGDRHHLGGFQASHYAGHQKVEGINYNSLNRIVTAFVSAALSAEGGAGAAVAQKQAAEEMRERAAKVAEDAGEPYTIHAQTGAMMFRACTEKIASAIRALPPSSSPEDQQKATATPTIADPDGEVRS